MKIHKSIMSRNQIEISGFESINQMNALVWSLDKHDDVLVVIPKLNLTIIVIVKPGKRNEIVNLLES